MVMVIEKDGLKVFGVKTFFSFFKFVFYADTPPYIITRCRYTKYDLSEKWIQFRTLQLVQKIGFENKLIKTLPLILIIQSLSVWISHPPFCPHTQESQWSLQVWQCQQSVQCQPERPQVCPTATGFSSSCSTASYPRMCIPKDCVRNREVKQKCNLSTEIILTTLTFISSHILSIMPLNIVNTAVGAGHWP